MPSKNPIITLTWLEVEQVAIAGCLRQINNFKHKRNSLHNPETSYGWDINIEGAGAEFGWAKLCDKFWDSVVEDPFKLKGDVGRVQIRSTTLASGNLIMHDKDMDEAPFVLCLGKIPTFEYVGWIRGREGKKMEYWKRNEKFKNGGAYFVPQKALFPIEDLIREATFKEPVDDWKFKSS